MTCSFFTGRSHRALGRWVCCLSLFVLGLSWVWALDVTNPAPVQGVSAQRLTDGVRLSWAPVTLDVLGAPEAGVQYRIYRGTAPDFIPDRAGGSNRIGLSATPEFIDTAALGAPLSYFYLVTAVDAAGNESGAQATAIVTPPILTSSWTDTTIELDWTTALPVSEVQRYRIYYGRAPGQYEAALDNGLSTHASLSGLATNVMWYLAVTAVDQRGNESAFSNEVPEVVAGRITIRAHNDDYLCWGAAKCPPRAGAIQRNDGWQLMVPAHFPPGNWTKASVTFTIDSRLCKVGQNGTTDKCGDKNPGGYNPCGDPWDRGAHLFMVMDSCIESGGNCVTPNNLELMNAITPFGTDAPAPLGDGKIPPRVLTLDITPYLPLLTGQRYIGAEIGHYVQAGWHVTSDFAFSKRPEDASAKKPADGIQVIGWGNTPFTPKSVTIPAEAKKVMMRLFTTGHGGGQFCDGGTKDGQSCTSSSQCPGGSCQACDEFCHRTNRILKNSSPVWTAIPWRNCCVPKFPGDPLCQGCTAWNSCGYPSCTYNRAGWCPGYIACHKDDPCDQDLDMTANFPPGATYQIGYDVLKQNGTWSVSLVLYWYK